MTRRLGYFPLLASLRGYGRQTFRLDLVAGLTTAVLLIPQSMAYAQLAGLPAVVGLYAALVPAALYALLGTARQLSVGPVAIDSLLVLAGVGALATPGSSEYIAYAAALALTAGAIQVAMGLLRMGYLVNFLSHPVISGFTSAAALVIVAGQLKHLLGISVDTSQPFFRLLRDLGVNAGRARPETLALGMGSIFVLLALAQKAPRAPRALLVVVLGSLAVYWFDWQGRLQVVGVVPAGLPALRWPALGWTQLRALLPTAVTVALVGFLESISVSKAYARKHGYQIAPDRELIALGAANFAGGLFQGYPVTGGLSRTAVSAQAGARTGVAALVTSLAVGLALLLLTPTFRYVPNAALAAIIVTAAIRLVDLHEFKRLWQIKRAEFGLLLLTFGATLLVGIVSGILCGVAVSLLWFFVQTTRPHVAALGRIPGTRQYKDLRRQAGLITYPGVLLLRMDAQFFFGNVAFLRQTLAQLEEDSSSPVKAVILDASAMNNLDSTAETALTELRADYAARAILFYLAGVKGSVRDVLDRSGFSAVKGQRGDFLAAQDALDDALRRLDADGDQATSAERLPGTAASSALSPRSLRATDGPSARPEAHPSTYVI